MDSLTTGLSNSCASIVKIKSLNDYYKERLTDPNFELFRTPTDLDVLRLGDSSISDSESAA